MFLSRWLLGSLCLILLPLGGARAQVLIQGTITDAETGEPLAAATIQEAGTYNGTITNAEGRYELQVSALPATVQVRFIGYNSVQRSLTPSSATQQDFRLEPVTYQLETVVITDENPAIRIMREVIERKKAWRERLESYEAEAYNRFTMANDTGIVSIMETLTQAFWDHERGTREVLKSKRLTSNMHMVDELPAAVFVANLYDDNLDIAGYNLRGVTHPDALDHYRFALVGQRYLDDQIVYDIEVAPKNKLKTGFQGRLSVLGEQYALIDVELEPSEAFLFPPPIQEFGVVYRQQFSNYGGDIWLPVDFRADMAIKVGMSAILSFPTFHIEQVSRFTNYDVNVSVPDTLYATEEYLRVDSVAVAADTLLSRPGVSVPLSRLEQQAYASIDSSLTLDKAYAPTGAMARFVKTSVNMNGEDVSSADEPNSNRRLSLPFEADLEPELWYNRVDELHAGLGGIITLQDRLELGANIGYSTGLDDGNEWSYGGEARFFFGENQQASLHAGYEAKTALHYFSNRYGRLVNSIYTVLGGDDYFDYYRNERFFAQAGYTFRDLDLSATASFNDEDHASLPQTTSFDLVGADPLRNNPAIPEGNLRSVGLRLTHGDGFSPFQLFGQNRIEVAVEHSSDALGSDFDFTTFRGSIDWRFPTLGQRRLIPNTLELRLVAGGSSGDVPRQRLGMVDGSMGAYRPFGVLHTRTGTPYQGDRHAGVFWEHNFRTLPFELLELRGLARRGYSVIVFGGHARTWLDPQPSFDDALDLDAGPAPYVSDGWHHEVGVSLSGLFGIFRVDVAKRLDADGFTVGIGAARLF